MEAWHQSTYYQLLKIVDPNSLAELRRHWTLYADFSSISSARLKKLKNEQDEVSTKIRNMLRTSGNVGVGRSTTVVWNEAAKLVSDQYGQFWQTGTTSTSPKDVKTAQLLNPTWVYSSQGEKFAAHMNTYPQAFHFVPCFVPIKSDPVGPNTPSVMEKAKQQFRAACAAFQASRAAGTIVLRFVVADALQYCRALEAYSKKGNKVTGILTAPWSASLIDLTDYFSSTPPPPATFDVIDTCQLMDSLGIINLLLVTQPLLKQSPASQSMVYTEANTISGRAALEIFIERIGTDPTTFALLVGLLPRAYIYAFSSQSNAHELIILEGRDHHQRVAWVDPLGGDKYARKGERPIPQFSSANIGNVMIKMFNAMFFLDVTPDFFAPATMPQLRTWSEPHYTRETVVLLLKHIQGRVQLSSGTWDDAIESFLVLVKADPETYLRMTHFEDLCLHLDLCGVRPLTESAKPGYGVFQGWEDVPSVVCVAFIVPSQKLDAIRRDDEMVPPKLVCNIRKNGNDDPHTHASIHAVWGKLVPGSDDKFTIEEDPGGIRGKSDLVVTFWVSSKLLEGNDASVSLALRYTPLSYKLYKPKLGADLELLKVKATSEHIRVLRECPTGSSQTQLVPRLEPSPLLSTPGDLTFQVVADMTIPKWYLKHITGRLEISSPDQQKALLEAAIVTKTQVGPCTLLVSVGDHTHTVTFPYPIRESQTNLRIARKSHYIEVRFKYLEPSFVY
jgi:hypothetical protein